MWLDLFFVLLLAHLVADFVFQTILHLCEYLGLTLIFPAKVFIPANHAVISANDYNAHVGTPLV